MVHIKKKSLKEKKRKQTSKERKNKVKNGGDCQKEATQGPRNLEGRREKDRLEVR